MYPTTANWIDLQEWSSSYQGTALPNKWRPHHHRCYNRTRIYHYIRWPNLNHNWPNLQSRLHEAERPLRHQHQIGHLVRGSASGNRRCVCDNEFAFLNFRFLFQVTWPETAVVYINNYQVGQYPGLPGWCFPTNHLQPKLDLSGQTYFLDAAVHHQPYVDQHMQFCQSKLNHCQ